MTKVIDAIFDGEVVRLSEKVNLEPNTRVEVHFHSASESPKNVIDEQPANLAEWYAMYAGSYDGPEDWSEEHDHYLYGTPKKNQI